MKVTELVTMALVASGAVFVSACTKEAAEPLGCPAAGGVGDSCWCDKELLDGSWQPGTQKCGANNDYVCECCTLEQSRTAVDFDNDLYGVDSCGNTDKTHPLELCWCPSQDGTACGTYTDPLDTFVLGDGCTDMSYCIQREEHNCEQIACGTNDDPFTCNEYSKGSVFRNTCTGPVVCYERFKGGTWDRGSNTATTGCGYGGTWAAGELHEFSLLDFTTLAECQQSVESSLVLYDWICVAASAPSSCLPLLEPTGFCEDSPIWPQCN